MTRKQFIVYAGVLLVAVGIGIVVFPIFLYTWMIDRAPSSAAVQRANAAPEKIPENWKWQMRGSGDTVFDMPSSVRRVKISGYSTGGAQNFAVKINRRLVVNELLGTNAGTDGVNFQGTYATQGGQVEIFGSNGVSWVFEEVR